MSPILFIYLPFFSHLSILKTPLMTLPGHKEAISEAVYTDNNEIFSASMDHTIKLWDAEIGGLKSEIAGNKSFSSLSWSSLNRTIITASFDRHIRLYDPRSTGEQHKRIIVLIDFMFTQ